MRVNMGFKKEIEEDDLKNSLFAIILVSLLL